MADIPSEKSTRLPIWPIDSPRFREMDSPLLRRMEGCDRAVCCGAVMSMGVSRAREPERGPGSVPSGDRGSAGWAARG